MCDVCKRCGGDSAVLDTRSSGDEVKRRRKCVSCGHRWSTFETTSRDISTHIKELRQAVLQADRLITSSLLPRLEEVRRIMRELESNQ